MGVDRATLCTVLSRASGDGSAVRAGRVLLVRFA